MSDSGEFAMLENVADNLVITESLHDEGCRRLMYMEYAGLVNVAFIGERRFTLKTMMEGSDTENSIKYYNVLGRFIQSTRHVSCPYTCRDERPKT